jgi:hypothetical protein
MERITSHQVVSLIEAYNAVYGSQELTEEQVWEEVENWVNSLVEEGHDLSEYTWEDMYEEYLNEMGQPGGNRPGGNRPDPAYDRSRFARPMNAGTPVSQGARRGAAPSRVTRPQIGSLPANYRGAELQQAARARASQVGTTRQGTAGGPTVGGNTPIGSAPTRPVAPTPTRPAAPAAARPAPAVSSRPSAPAPAAARPTTAPAAPTTAKPSPTVPNLPGLSGTGALATPAKRPSLASQKSDIGDMIKRSQARQGLTQSFDVFDVIKGHLIDEGYADTEEAALQIMANMSEEWREGILEGRVASETMGSGLSN